MLSAEEQVERAEVNRKRNLVRYQTNNYLKRHDILKPWCQICGETKTQMHHVDYDDPYLINFLCQDCHAGVESHRLFSPNPIDIRSPIAIENLNKGIRPEPKSKIIRGGSQMKMGTAITGVMRDRGITQTALAKKVNYKTQSEVSQRLTRCGDILLSTVFTLLDGIEYELVIQPKGKPEKAIVITKEEN